MQSLCQNSQKMILTNIMESIEIQFIWSTFREEECVFYHYGKVRRHIVDILLIICKQ